MKKISGYLAISIVFTFLAAKKAFAEVQALYGPPVTGQFLYGVLPPTPQDYVLNIIKIFAIPVVVIIILFFGIRKKIRNKQKK